MSTHLWGQLLELSPLGGRRYPGDRSGHAHRRTRMHRLQLSSLIHVAISEALKCSVIWIEKANAVTFPITFYWMILHSGLRKGDISIWQGKKKDIFNFTFFFFPLPWNVLPLKAEPERAWKNSKVISSPQHGQGRAVASQGTRAGQAWLLQKHCVLSPFHSPCASFGGEYTPSLYAILNSFSVYLST